MERFQSAVNITSNLHLQIVLGHVAQLKSNVSVKLQSRRQTYTRLKFFSLKERKLIRQSHLISFSISLFDLAVFYL